MPPAKNEKPKAAAVPVVPARPTVSLNLTEFYPISPSGRFCKLGSADPLNPIAQMTVIADGAQSVGLFNSGVGGGAPNGGLKVKKLSLVTLSLSPQPSVQGGPFAFAGLTLVPLSGAPTDGNFSASRWTPSWLQFLVSFGNRGGKWKLYVSILDYSTGAPVLGLIDPEVENDVPALDPKSP